MSARILSMGFTTLRFTRAGHKIACRYFLTHLMNIGSPTLRFRDCGDAPSSDPHATGHMQSVLRALGTIRGRKTGVSWDFRSRPQNEFRPAPVPSLHLLLLSCILRDSVMLNGNL